MPAKGDVIQDPLVIAGREFRSRLLTGSGKYDSPEVMRGAGIASGGAMVTGPVRRIDFDEPVDDITGHLPPDVLLLPNTSGAETADEAVRAARLARAGGLPDWIKLEVIPDPRYLLPDPVETLRAAAMLVDEGFTVLPYVLPDPVLQKKLEEVGCATVMPLAAPIGSGRGLRLRDSIRIMIEQAEVPVVVDAGLRSPAQAIPWRWPGPSGSPSRPAAAPSSQGSWRSRRPLLPRAPSGGRFDRHRPRQRPRARSGRRRDRCGAPGAARSGGTVRARRAERRAP